MNFIDKELIIDSVNKARRLHAIGQLNNNLLKSTSQDFWNIPTKTSDINKDKLLQLAKIKSNRPSKKKHKLGQALVSYTSTTRNSYDPIFTKKIKSIAPHWFISTSQTKKEELLRLAQNKQPRPSKTSTRLGQSLINYTNKSSKSYDDIFTKKLKKLAPNWFQSTSENNKTRLLKLAKSNKPKPIKRKHELGEALARYTNPNNQSYDPTFTKKIKALAPHWLKRSV